MKKEIQKLKKYFSSQNDIVFAFLFGSQASKRAARISDWDIGVYFRPVKERIEWEEQNRPYLQEDKIWNECMDILSADNVDLLVLNRCAANIAASAIRGIPLVIKDRRQYLEFMLAVTQEAEDFRQTSRDYVKIYWRSSSLSGEDKDILNRRLIFLDSELRDASRFQGLTLKEYESDKTKAREVERWIENLMNASIDIAKTILASQKKPMPSTYREILSGIGFLADLAREKGFSDKLCSWSGLRNILAHEYLDIRWRRIEEFLKESQPVLEGYIKAVREFIK